MEKSILFDLAITIVVIAAITGFIYFRIKIKEKKSFSYIENFVTEHGSLIKTYDHLDKTYIALDDSKQKRLFFIRYTPAGEHRFVIPVSELAACRLEKTARMVQVHQQNNNVIDRIEMVLSWKDKQKTDTSLEFYNTEYNSMTMTGELQVAEKWLNLIREGIHYERRSADLNNLNKIRIRAATNRGDKTSVIPIDQNSSSKGSTRLPRAV